MRTCRIEVAYSPGGTSFIMSSENLDTRIGHAWGHQRDGEYETAIKEFEQVLRQDPNNIDANYGMGLAHRSAGNFQEATLHFQRALDVVTERDSAGLAAREVAASQNEGQRIKPNTAEDDRYMMLTRMLKQRLVETEQAGKS
jgi:tetratricopeptide (TPR) repeat protein